MNVSSSWISKKGKLIILMMARNHVIMSHIFGSILGGTNIFPASTLIAFSINWDRYKYFYFSWQQPVLNQKPSTWLSHASGKENLLHAHRSLIACAAPLRAEIPEYILQGIF